MGLFSHLNRLFWPIRWVVKTMIVALAALLACFPHVPRLWRHIEHWRDPNALIEPNAPGLEPWAREFRGLLGAGSTPQEALARVEPFVVQRLPYAWDWEIWGNADYLPTVEEILDAGREDCDGRAVIAASLLSAAGYKTRLATDFAHVWVETDYGATMSPGETKAVVAGDQGLSVNTSGLGQIPKAAAFGMSVFYLHRELIVLLVLWVMLLRPGRSRWRGAAALLSLIAGLLLVRYGGRTWPDPQSGWEITGAVMLPLAILLCSAAGQRRRGNDAVSEKPVPRVSASQTTP